MSSHNPAFVFDPTKILACRYGMFSHRWSEMCKCHGFDARQLNATWGVGARAAELQGALEADRNHGIKAVLVTYNETAPGVRSGVAAAKGHYRDTASALSEAA